jgi:hypothetical protein
MRRSRVNPLIAIRNESRMVLTDYQIVRMIPSIQRQITEHFQPAWGFGAQIIFCEHSVPRDAYQIIIYDKARAKDDDGYLGYHFSAEGYPVASIFALQDMNEDGTISDTLSHEILEMLVDPACNMYAHRPAWGTRPGRGYFYEVCDPVQGFKYEIDGILVTDFVYPEWYEDNWPAGSRKFDHLGKVKRPFEVMNGGYAEIYERGKKGKDGAFTTIWGRGSGESHKKRHRRKAHRKTRGSGAN